MREVKKSDPKKKRAPSKREQAKAAAAAALAKIHKKGQRVIPVVRAEKPIASLAEAVRELSKPPAPVLALEEPNGQRVIPGAGAARSVLEEKPGDANPYVLTLRMTRGDARRLRIVAAHAGFQFPAQWVLDVMNRAMTAELDALEKRGRA